MPHSDPALALRRRSVAYPVELQLLHRPAWAPGGHRRSPLATQLAVPEPSSFRNHDLPHGEHAVAAGTHVDALADLAGPDHWRGIAAAPREPCDDGPPAGTPSR